jgi:hypothetical protein
MGKPVWSTRYSMGFVAARTTDWSPRRFRWVVMVRRGDSGSSTSVAAMAAMAVMPAHSSRPGTRSPCSTRRRRWVAGDRRRGEEGGVSERRSTVEGWIDDLTRVGSDYDLILVPLRTAPPPAGRVRHRRLAGLHRSGGRLSVMTPNTVARSAAPSSPLTVTAVDGGCGGHARRGPERVVAAVDSWRRRGLRRLVPSHSRARLWPRLTSTRQSGPGGRSRPRGVPSRLDEPVFQRLPRVEA